MERSIARAGADAEERIDTDDRRVCLRCGYRTTATPCDRCQGRVVDAHGHALRIGRSGAPFDLARGFFALFAGGLLLFTRPEFAGRLRTPFIANFVVLGVTFFGLFLGLWELFAALLAGSWGWLEFLHPIGTYAAGALSLVLAAITLFLLAPVLIETVMGPFLDPLAATTERIHGVRTTAADDIGPWRGALTGLRSAAQIYAIQLIVLPLCLLLALTGIGAIVAIVLAALLNAIVWFDLPAARRGLGLRERLALLRRNWASALGFGLAFQIGIVIPIFNFVLLTPAAAVAVSTLYFRFDKGSASR